MFIVIARPVQPRSRGARCIVRLHAAPLEPSLIAGSCYKHLVPPGPKQNSNNTLLPHYLWGRPSVAARRGTRSFATQSIGHLTKRSIRRRAAAEGRPVQYVPNSLCSPKTDCLQTDLSPVNLLARGPTKFTFCSKNRRKRIWHEASTRAVLAFSEQFFALEKLNVSPPRL